MANKVKNDPSAGSGQENEKKGSYLGRLRFDPKLLNSLQAKYLSNVRLPILFILTIIIVGVFALTSIPRRLNPEIKIPIVVVNTILPGAGPEDVESLVTLPLERKLTSVDGLDTISSVSRESASTITITFLSSVDVDEAAKDVQTLVNRVTNLPEDATDPDIITVDFEDQPFWTFAVTSKSDTASLMRFADNLKDEIENVAQVDRVTTSGLIDQTIEVTIDLNRAKEFNINPAEISGLVKTAAKAFPAGSVNSSSSSFALTINRGIFSLDDIRDLRLNVSGSNVRLGDIATISERSKSGQSGTYVTTKDKTPERTVQFFVFKKKNADIDKAFQATEPVVNEQIEKYKGQFTLFTVLNTADEITKQFDELYGEFQTTIFFVFILLLIFLGLRQAIISTITVPLTFLASFAIINAMGLTLNFLTMFSFLLSLGLLIDDTIVSVAAMTRYYRTGRFTPYQTGLMVWRDFIVPLWSTTITTIWAFVPLLLATGIIGEFIKSIPIVVTTTMLSSTTIAVLITIPLMIVFLKPQFPRRVRVLFVVLGLLLIILVPALVLPRNSLLPLIILAIILTLAITYRVRKDLVTRYRYIIRTNKRAAFVSEKAQGIADHGLINTHYLSDRYKRIIDKILVSRRARKRTIIAIVVFAVVAYLLVPLGFVKNEFFPKEDADLLYIGVDLPPGTNSEIVTKEALALSERLKKTPELDYVVTEAGQVIQPDGNRDSDPDAVLFTLHLRSAEERDLTSGDIAQSVRNSFGDYTAGTFSVVELTGGPPAGADVQVKLLGPDLGILNQYSDKLVAYLKKQDGLVNVDKSIKPGTSKVVFVPDATKLADADLSVNDVGLWLRTYASGFTLDSILFDDEEKDIVFRTNSYDDKTLEELGSIEIPLKTGGTVPLLSLGKFTLETNPTLITREDEKRTISVFAGVTAGANIPEKNAELLKYAEDLNMPTGYEIATGGVNEENQKSVTSILQAMVISFLLILITMVIEFGSFRQALIAMLIIPISIAGVFYIFALTRTPLSFAALIGILALFGIVVTHAIVVIEKINENRKEGMPLAEAITDAAANRLEPVLLTSLATIVGLLPITIADPFWRGLGGAIIAGLLFSGAIKLFFVPVLYYNFYKDSEGNKKNKRR